MTKAVKRNISRESTVYFILIIESSTEYLYALTPNLSILNSDPDFQGCNYILKKYLNCSLLEID